MRIRGSSDAIERTFADINDGAALERLYRQFRDGFWITGQIIESNPALKAKIAAHKVVYAQGRDAIVIDEPFLCEHL